MEKFNFASQDNVLNNKKEVKENTDPTTFESLRTSLKRFGVASALFLASFGYSEAQQKKVECSTQNIKLTQEQTIEMSKHKEACDSLSDVLFAEAKKHNLLKSYKEAPQNKWEADSSEHIYYKSRLASFGDKNAIIMYQKTKNKTNTLPASSETMFKAESKSICANGKLFVLNESIFGISNYNNPDLIKEDNFSAGNKSALFNSTPDYSDELTSNHGFTVVDFIKSSKDVETKLKSEIELVRGMK